MTLEDYFEFETFDTEHGVAERIRVKGTRIRIEIIVEEFQIGRPPKEIQERFPTLTLEQVYAAVTYYLHNQEAVDAYIKRGEVIEEAYYQDYLRLGPNWLKDGARDRASREAPAGETARE